MEKKQITFFGKVIIVDDRPASLEVFKAALSEIQYEILSELKVVIYSIDFDDDFLKIKMGDGSVMPRNPLVYDVVKKEHLPNPRQISQVEPKETFVVIDFKKSYLWISNSNKKQAVLEFLKKKINKNIIFKDLFDENEFINNLHTLDQIKISAAPDIFSNSNVLSEHLVEDINGYEADIATLIFSYNKKITVPGLINKIRKLIGGRSAFRSVVISGKTDRGFGILFNTDEVSRKIEFKAPVDDNGMFIPENVFSSAMSAIKNENN